MIASMNTENSYPESYG
jgi:hypothetical protein